MNNRLSLDDVERILADVKPEQSFWVNNGPIVRNLQEMADTLAYMKEETFRHHVNEQKNDISNWIRDVLKDNELANSIMDIKSKEKILKKIRERIYFLDSMQEKIRHIGQ